MINDFHFLRPAWLLLFIPSLFFLVRLLKRSTSVTVWEQVCDSHLLPQLLSTHGSNHRKWAIVLLASSLGFMIFALAGPAWQRLPVPTYKTIQPRVILLDMSSSMLQDDLSPNRLERAKFKLHDLFSQQKKQGQYGLIVYSGEPFIASPLTDDSETIDSLLSSLSPEVMPIEGNNLQAGLVEAANLFKQAGYHNGAILILTSAAPSSSAIEQAASLATLGLNISIVPMLKDQSALSAFKELAKAGNGSLIPYADDSMDIEKWLNAQSTNAQYESKDQNIPIWRDEGRWFLIPALLCLLPAFRKGWLQQVKAC